MQVDLGPPESKLAALADEAERAASDPNRIGEAVDLRQHCLALAQLACRDDPLQLARASADLAVAYLLAGGGAAAARHAAHAESLLIHAGPPSHAAELMAQTLLTLARALTLRPADFARAQECFPRALAQCERAHGTHSMQLCPLLRSFARMLAQSSQQPRSGGSGGSSRGGGYSRAEVLLRREREIHVEHASNGDEATGGGADAPAAWSRATRAAVARLDQERAVLLLKHAKVLDARVAEQRDGTAADAKSGGGGGGKGAEPHTYAVAPGFVQRPPQRRRPTSSMMPPVEKPLVHKQRVATAHGARTDVRAGVATGPHGRYLGGGGGGGGGGAVPGGGGSADAPILAAVSGSGGGGGDAEAASRESSAELVARATRKRREATALLEGSEALVASVDGAGADAASSVADAQLAVQLANAHKELGQWEAAERAYMKAIPALEDARGCSDGSVLELWSDLVAIRMQTLRYDEAAADCEHVLNMLRLTRGPTSAELIPVAERLAKAHVLARRWPDARDALTTAYTISSGRFGPEHRDTLRIADVLQSLERYAKPRGR